MNANKSPVKLFTSAKSTDVDFVDVVVGSDSVVDWTSQPVCYTYCHIFIGDGKITSLLRDIVSERLTILSSPNISRSFKAQLGGKFLGI